MQIHGGRLAGFFTEAGLREAGDSASRTRVQRLSESRMTIQASAAQASSKASSTTLRFASFAFVLLTIIALGAVAFFTERGIVVSRDWVIIATKCGRNSTISNSKSLAPMPTRQTLCCCMIGKTFRNPGSSPTWRSRRSTNFGGSRAIVLASNCAWRHWALCSTRMLHSLRSSRAPAEVV